MEPQELVFIFLTKAAYSQIVLTEMISKFLINVVFLLETILPFKETYFHPHHPSRVFHGLNARWHRLLTTFFIALLLKQGRVPRQICSTISTQFNSFLETKTVFSCILIKKSKQGNFDFFQARIFPSFLIKRGSFIKTLVMS